MNSRWQEQCNGSLQTGCRSESRIGIYWQRKSPVCKLNVKLQAFLPTDCIVKYCPLSNIGLFHREKVDSLQCWILVCIPTRFWWDSLLNACGGEWDWATEIEIMKLGFCWHGKSLRFLHRVSFKLVTHHMEVTGHICCVLSSYCCLLILKKQNAHKFYSN